MHLMVVIFTVILSSLRLTIATGTLNGVILYANIVQVNRRFFIPADATNLFLAWLNLDLDFQTCFYDGLDAYMISVCFPSLYVYCIYHNREQVLHDSI